MVFHFCEGEAVLGVAISFDDQGVDFSVLFELAGKICFEFFGVGLDGEGVTFPSRLVMKSLVGFSAGEGDRFLLEETD